MYEVASDVFWNIPESIFSEVKEEKKSILRPQTLDVYKRQEICSEKSSRWENKNILR